MSEFTSTSYKVNGRRSSRLLGCVSWNRISATWISRESMSNGHSLFFSKRNHHLNKKLGEEWILPSWLHLPGVELLPHWAEGEKGAKTKITYILYNLYNHVQEWWPEFPNYKSKPHYCTKTWIYLQYASNNIYNDEYSYLLLSTYNVLSTLLNFHI